MKQYIFLALWLCLFLSGANAAVHVDRTLSYYLPDIDVEIAPREYNVFQLISQNNASGVNSIDISVEVTNSLFPDITVLVCDEPNMRLFAQRAQHQCQGITKGRKHFSFSVQPRKSSNYFLVVDNLYSSMTRKKLHIRSHINHTISKEIHTETVSMLESLAKGIQQDFIVDEFDISIHSCGKENAFSAYDGGHITLCSELMISALINNQPEIFTAITLHELGHTLLNLWELPNWNNELTADEFAAFMFLMMGKEEAIPKWAQWFKDNANIVAEFFAIKNGEAHPSSAQRVNALAFIVANKEDTARRWNNIIYPRFTNERLESIVEGRSTFSFADVELAKATLEKRHSRK